jgi:hypothetical protein
LKFLLTLQNKRAIAFIERDFRNERGSFFVAISFQASGVSGQPNCAILDQIAAGVPYTRFRGKRFRYDRTVISVPLGRRYRLLFQDEGGALHPLCCLSHEAYNHWKPRG